MIKMEMCGILTMKFQDMVEFDELHHCHDCNPKECLRHYCFWKETNISDVFVHVMDSINCHGFNLNAKLYILITFTIFMLTLQKLFSCFYIDIDYDVTTMSLALKMFSP